MTFHQLFLLFPSLAFKAIRRPQFTIAAPISIINGTTVCPSCFSLRETVILHCPLTRTLYGCSEKGGILPSPLRNRKNPFTRSSVLFVLAALRTRPKTYRPERTPRDQLRTTAALDVIRKHSSFTPMEAPRDKWVEADRNFSKKLLTTVEDTRRNANLKVLSRPLTIASARTGFSQYFLGPSLSSSDSSPDLRDLFSLLRTHIPQSLLADELRERSAAHHYWTVLHPLQLAHDMAFVADSMVFTIKQEGVRSVPLPTLLRGIQDAVSLSFDHLEEICARSLTNAIQVKVAIREFLLGALKPHTLRDPLLASDLIHPMIFAPDALEAVVPILKAAMDARAVCDHAGCIPFPSNSRSFPRRKMSPGHCPGAYPPPRQWAQPPLASPLQPSLPQVEDRGAVLADLQRQVADLKSQLHAPSGDAPCPSTGRGSHRGRNRQGRRGRGFFRGAAGSSRGCASSSRQQSRGSTSGAPASSRGPWGRRRY